MKIIKRATSVAVSFIALLAMTIPVQAFASTGSVDSVSSVKACDFLGKHKGIENKRRVFIPGVGEHAYIVGPHQSFSHSIKDDFTVKGSLTFNADAGFWSLAKVQLSGTVEMSKTTSKSDTWRVTNNTNSTKYYEMGSYGYEFDYVTYEVVAPCNVINMQRRHGKLPTDAIGLVEVRR